MKTLFGEIIFYPISASPNVEIIREELEYIKYTYGNNIKVIITTEFYIDELVDQCESYLYDAYMLSSDRGEVLVQAVENIRAGKCYWSETIIKAYCRSRRLGNAM